MRESVLLKALNTGPRIVLVKPFVYFQELYLGSLRALGIDSLRHDIRFVEDNWESPVLGAWGLGWEVWLDGMEITQFTYFQQVSGNDRHEHGSGYLHQNESNLAAFLSFKLSFKLLSFFESHHGCNSGRVNND